MNKGRILYISFLGILEPVAFRRFSYLIKLAEDKLKIYASYAGKDSFLQKKIICGMRKYEKSFLGWHRLVYAKTS